MTTPIVVLLVAFAFGAGLAIAVLWRPRGARPQRREVIEAERQPDGPAALTSIVEPTMLLKRHLVRYANPAATALFGETVTGQDVRLIIRHPDALQLIGSGRAGQVEYPGPGGPDHRLELRIGAMTDGWQLLQLIDRTARALADRTRTDFVANASHELRTPLAAIRGFVETLEDDEAGADRDTRLRFLTVMHAEARRMERLIDELISLSRIEAEKYVLPDTIVDLATLIDDVMAETHGRDGQPLDGLRFEVDGTAVVRGDPTQLAQVVHNLLDNARRYGGEGVAIAVQLALAPREVTLSVVDDGPGIGAEHLPRLTERFYRVDPARSRASGGTGLGLAIVKHIVERHRGRLTIDSKPGGGTRVGVTLPIAAPAPVTETSPN